MTDIPVSVQTLYLNIVLTQVYYQQGSLPGCEEYCYKCGGRHKERCAGKYIFEKHATIKISHIYEIPSRSRMSLSRSLL